MHLSLTWSTLYELQCLHSPMNPFSTTHKNKFQQNIAWKRKCHPTLNKPCKTVMKEWSLTSCKSHCQWHTQDKIKRYFILRFVNQQKQYINTFFFFWNQWVSKTSTSKLIETYYKPHKHLMSQENVHKMNSLPLSSSQQKNLLIWDNARLERIKISTELLSAQTQKMFSILR